MSISDSAELNHIIVKWRTGLTFGPNINCMEKGKKCKSFECYNFSYLGIL